MSFFFIDLPPWQDDIEVRLFLCGDVMTGRGIDQVLPHPSKPILYEPLICDARGYVGLAERAKGLIPRRVNFEYIWGDALAELDAAGVDARIINLETAITAAETNWPNKGIHYRMHPKNISCLSAAKIDVCALANNHILDWGYTGLSETVRTLDAADIAHSGAGENAEQALAPATPKPFASPNHFGVVDLAGKGRVLVFSFGSTSSGIPREWAAAEDAPGVNLLPDLSEETAAGIARDIKKFRQPGDLVVASIHWGSNWGYEVPRKQITFARRLIDEGIAIVHGHSSHHAKSIEVYKGRLILYGCGDFLTDYEGISGYEEFPGNIAIMYLIDLYCNGELLAARLVPLRMNRFRLERTPAADAEFVCELLNDLGARFSTRARVTADRSLTLEW